MRTVLRALAVGLLLGGAALAGDEAGTQPLDAAAKEALRQELVAAYRAQTEVNLAWDVVFTPGPEDEHEPLRLRVELYVDGSYVAARCASTTEDWSLDAVGTADGVYCVTPEQAWRSPSARMLNEAFTRLLAVLKDLGRRFGVETGRARAAGAPDAKTDEPYRTAFGFVVDEAKDDTLDFAFKLVVDPDAEPRWLAKELFEAKDVTRPAGDRVLLRSARAELEVDVATGMLLRARATKKRLASVMTAERAASVTTPEAWQTRIQAVLARSRGAPSRQLTYDFLVVMACGAGLLVACTTADPAEQAARLSEVTPELIATVFGAPDCLEAIDEGIGQDPGEDEKAGIAYLLAECWVAELDRCTEGLETSEMIEDTTTLPEGLDVDAAWERTREALRAEIRRYVEHQVDARWPAGRPHDPTAGSER